MKPTLTNVYVLRHARAEQGNFENAHRPLSQAGKDHAQILISILKPLNLSAVYSSPFQRAISTVEPFCNEANLPIQVQVELKESTKEETMEAIQNRIITFIQSQVKIHSGKSILLCTHGGVLFGLMSSFVPSFTYDDYLKIGNPDLKRFEYTNDSGSYDDKFKIDSVQLFK